MTYQTSIAHTLSLRYSQEGKFDMIYIFKGNTLQETVEKANIFCHHMNLEILQFFQTHEIKNHQWIITTLTKEMINETEYLEE